MQAFFDYLPGILMVYAAFLLAIASPGPNVLAIMGTSMCLGRRHGIALAFGIAAGSFSWSFLTVVGLSAVLAAYSSLLIVIKILGGLYLLWLAYKSFRSAASKQDIDALSPSNNSRSLFGYTRRGYVVMMTNPKAVLAWIGIVSLGLQDNAPWWVGGAIVAGTTLMSVLIHVVYAVAFSTSIMVRFYAKARRVFQTILGTFFAAAGMKLLSEH